MNLIYKLLLSVTLLLSTTYASETSPTKEEVAKLYVATFNRAPDAGGLNYWMNESFDGHPTLSGIARSFFDQPETKVLYPDGNSNEAFINSIYANLFNRTPDTGGYNYWKAELDSGKAKRDFFILMVINGAQDNVDGMDKTILDNKNEVGLAFAAAGLGNDDSPTEVMSGVTADSNTVDFIKDIINHGSIGENVWGDNQASIEDYFPKYARDNANNKINASWTYKLNSGSPINANFESISMRMTPSLMTMTIDYKQLKSHMEYSGSISANVDGTNITGDFTTYANQYFTTNPESVFINKSDMSLTMTLTDGYDPIGISIDSTMNYTDSAEYLPMKNNLNDLQLSYQENDTISGTASATVDTTVSSSTSDSTQFSDTVSWEIINKISSMVVQGKTYQDIIVIEKTETMPPNALSNSSSTLISTIYLARAIGIIKATSAVGLLGTYTDQELVSTNLNQDNKLLNYLPIANAGEDRTVLYNETVNFNGLSSSDLDGEILKYTWMEGSTILSNSNSFSKSDFDVGTHILTLAVTDDDWTTSTDTITITVSTSDDSTNNDSNNNNFETLTNGTYAPTETTNYYLTMPNNGNLDIDCTGYRNVTIYDQNLNVVHASSKNDRTVSLNAGTYIVKISGFSGYSVTFYASALDNENNFESLTNGTYKPTETTNYYLTMPNNGNLDIDCTGYRNVTIYDQNLNVVHASSKNDRTVSLNAGTYIVKISGFSGYSVTFFSPLI